MKLLRYLFGARRRLTSQQARELVAQIPCEQLGDHAYTFAEQALRTTDPVKRGLQWAKFGAACDRITRELEGRE